MTGHQLTTHQFNKWRSASQRALQDEPMFGWQHVFHGWELLREGVLETAA